ncbi:MAG TPA: aminoacetone oxidase family FAD-binding enzyme, partial [Gammaproteobacteria bacterium]
MQKFDVIIIGAGAAGLMCALTAGQRGRRVLVLDHANKVGKKILMSGGGRCNFTHLYTTPDNYVSHNPHFCKSALKRYTPYDFLALIDKHQIEYVHKDEGQLFCQHSSKEVLQLLLDECADAHVEIKTRCSVNNIRHDNHFVLTTSDGEFECESLVIATGGLSIPTLGASGFGYDVARQFGLNVYPLRAGLVPFTLAPDLRDPLKELAGLSVDVAVTCGDVTMKDAMLFTHRGLS